MICTPNWRETSNTKSEVKIKLKVSPILVNMQGHSMFNHFLNGVWCDDLLMQRTVPQDELLIMALLTSSLPVRISSVITGCVILWRCDPTGSNWQHTSLLPRYLPDPGQWLKPKLFVYFQAEPIRVVVTGAAGQIAYSLLYSIAKGDVFGKDQVRSSLNSDYIICSRSSSSSSRASFPLKPITAQAAGRCTVWGLTVA